MILMSFNTVVEISVLVILMISKNYVYYLFLLTRHARGVTLAVSTQIT